MSQHILNEEDYNHILQRRFATSDIKFVKSVIKPLSEGQGYLGDHYNLAITYELNSERKVEHFFIKTKPVKNKALREIADATGIFALEIFLYDFLFPDFEKYGIDTSFAPKCYYCVRDETLIMEDMTKRGYYVPSGMKFYNLDECKSGLRALALYHASGLIYEEAKSKELGRPFCLNVEYSKFFEEKFITYCHEKRNLQGEEWFTVSMQVYAALIDFLPETEEYRKEFQDRLMNMPIGKVFVEETKIKKFCGHGDLWPNNMLFKSENGVVNQCCLVDFQIARYFYVSFDVLLFLLSNTTIEFFKKHSETLFNFYYETLSKVLAKHDISVEDYYPEEDYRKSLDIVEFEARVQAHSVHTFVHIPDEFVQEFIKDGDDVKQYKFKNRLALAKAYFKKGKQYRNMVTADLYELRACLFKV